MSEYLRRIRSLVGRELLLLPSVTLLTFDMEGRLLLAKHRATGRWVAPGGMVEPDEAPSAAALREMREETGCEAQLRGIIGCFGGPSFRVTYDNADQAAYVMTVYRARIISGEPRPNHEETVEVRFVTPEEAAELDLSEWLGEVLRSREVSFLK